MGHYQRTIHIMIRVKSPTITHSHKTERTVQIDATLNGIISILRISSPIAISATSGISSPMYFPSLGVSSITFVNHLRIDGNIAFDCIIFSYQGVFLSNFRISTPTVNIVTLSCLFFFNTDIELLRTAPIPPAWIVIFIDIYVQRITRSSCPLTEIRLISQFRSLNRCKISSIVILTSPLHFIIIQHF